MPARPHTLQIVPDVSSGAAATTAPGAGAKASCGTFAADRVLVLVFALSWLAVFGLLLFGPMRTVVLRLVTDDAFYYFHIACNWAEGAPSSFDGLTQTNGYHPLWQYMMVGLALAGGSVDGLVRAGSALSAVFVLLGALLIYERLRRLGNRWAAFALLWTAGGLVFSPIYGMESPLAILLFGAIVAAFPANGDALTSRRAILCGALTGLLFLARIDSVPWVAAADVALLIGCATATGPRRRAAIRFVALTVALQFVIAGIYFVSNRAAWGHFLPISSLVKLGRNPGISFAAPWNIPQDTLYFVALVPIAAGLIVVARRLPGILQRREWVQSPLMGLVVWATLGDYGYFFALLSKGGPETYYWYFAILAFSGAFLVPVFLDDLSLGWSAKHRRILYAVAVVGCLVPAPFHIQSKLLRQNDTEPVYDRALALATFPKNSLVLAAPDCGVLGTFSRQHCLNLDGLTGSFEFQEALRTGTFPQFLKAHGFNLVMEEGQLGKQESVVVQSKVGMDGNGRSALVQVEPWKELTIGPEGHRRPLALYRVLDIRAPEAPSPHSGI